MPAWVPHFWPVLPEVEIFPKTGRGAAFSITATGCDGRVGVESRIETARKRERAAGMLPPALHCPT